PRSAHSPDLTRVSGQKAARRAALQQKHRSESESRASQGIQAAPAESVRRPLPSDNRGRQHPIHTVGLTIVKRHKALPHRGAAAGEREALAAVANETNPRTGHRALKCEEEVSREGGHREEKAVEYPRDGHLKPSHPRENKSDLNPEVAKLEG